MSGENSLLRGWWGTGIACPDKLWILHHGGPQAQVGQCLSQPDLVGGKPAQSREDSTRLFDYWVPSTLSMILCHKAPALQHWNLPLCNIKCPISTVSMTVKDDKLPLKLLSFTALRKKFLLCYSPYRNTCQKLQQTSLQTLRLKGTIFKNSSRKKKTQNKRKKILSRQGKNWDACMLSRSL